MAKILSGKALSEKIMLDLKNEISIKNYAPSLAVVIVGDNSASRIYVNRKNIKAREIGIKSEIIALDADISQEKLEAEINKLCQNPDINAVLVQLPLSAHLNTQSILNLIPPEKDVDGFSPINAGWLSAGAKPYAIPCTPLGIIKLLKSYDIEIEGKSAVVIGRSNIVGRPMASLLEKENATVTICHSRTRDITAFTRHADILISAVGKANFIDDGWIKEGVIIVDVGMNRNEDGKLTGDVDFEKVQQKASAITPVPGGVGPMTIATLMSNTLRLYKLQKGIRE
ncbi:MAG: bifunctional 5,10-methylenetetrahydrofolate dehydrogenase/5,10-methenyltetrahydrofolate cyclohydrolase [Candidatus Gastranaerophilales bacterium]|nr:bifunctional 5,10-methylenetetrahydrofolate dehydrogenase/5,10-methenyltetrahydrofolate cyclohydrolase [Candidatus Gastranaerophilales bacterium]